jgi:hypothetical protein
VPTTAGIGRFILQIGDEDVSTQRAPLSTMRDLKILCQPVSSPSAIMRWRTTRRERMKKYALVAVICAGFLAGCASHMDRSFEPMDWTDWWSSSCKSKDTTAGCFIVVDAWEVGDGTCAAAVITSQESVGFARDAKDKKVEWRFTDIAEKNGFRFLKDTGIEPKSTPAGNDANWKENFEADTVGGGKKFKLKNKNKESQTKEIEYFYMVRVQLERQGMQPLICKPQDPVIRNQR